MDPKAVVALRTTATLSRRQRLERWANLLDREPDRRLTALTRVEFVAERHRAHMRDDNTPMSVAFADPVLKGAGLQGDTLGDAQSFFELTSNEAHRLLCDCYYFGQMDAGTVAHRLRAMSKPPLIQRLFRVSLGS
ncbi:MAG TPA: hypothetical protein VGG92_11650 [Caulobacteraceae bacterium]